MKLMAVVLGGLIGCASLAGAGTGAGAAKPATAAQPGVAYAWGQGIADTPTPVAGIPTDVVDIQAANWGGLAVDSTGTVWQWNSTSVPTASQVTGPQNVVSIGEGNGAPNAWGAAVTAGGVLWTWGNDGKGQLCNGSHQNTYFQPAPVSGLSHVTEVSGGQEHLTILAGGKVWSCGTNVDGQLGTGDTTNSDVPVQVPGLSGITAVSAGNLYSLALTSAGSVWSWGINNLGQLGNGSTVPYSDVPVQVQLTSAAAQVFAGGGTHSDGQSLALLENGQVWAWGSDTYGQLGNGKTSKKSYSTPVQSTVLEGRTWIAVATGGSTSYAIDSDGELWSWGNGKSGALGNGTTSGDVTTPVMVMSGVAQVSSVANTTTALG
jgi:alpha-tubulin suppressor-like RCC1 family protein